MTFQPVIPTGGFAGWSFLARTREAQQAAFEASPSIARDVAAFEDRIGSVASAEDLVADRQLLRVALGAFGLDDDIGNRYFVRKILEDGTLDPAALANRLSDKRYFEMSKAFGFGDFDTPRTVLSDFAAEITTAYKERQFEVAVGDRNADMRLVLALDRDLTAIATKDTTANGMWYSIMGQPPLRQVFETALGLPTSVGALDLDQQLSVFRDKTLARFGDGDVAQFADPEKREDLARLFLVRSDIQSAGAGLSSGSAALMLLQNAGGGSLLGSLA